MGNWRKDVVRVFLGNKSKMHVHWNIFLFNKWAVLCSKLVFFEEWIICLKRSKAIYFMRIC